MRVARAVVERKYIREVQRLRDQRTLLQERHIFLLEEPLFPSIDLLFVPMAPLLLATKGGPLPPGAPPDAKVMREVRALSARAFIARLSLDDYDLRAPSVAFLDPVSKAPLEYDKMLRAMEFEPTRGLHPVLLDKHPTTGLPFLCLRGIREYHEHPQHTGDPWLLYRGTMSAFSAVMSLWRAAIDLTAPLLDVEVNKIVWVGQTKA